MLHGAAVPLEVFGFVVPLQSGPRHAWHAFLIGEFVARQMGAGWWFKGLGRAGFSGCVCGAGVAVWPVCMTVCMACLH